MSKNEKKPLRKPTNQPGVYKNTKTGKYDVKYCYTTVDPMTSEKKYMQKWDYNINSYADAVRRLNEKKGAKFRPSNKDFTLKDAYNLWVEKATANDYSPLTMRNTMQQFYMIKKFWSENIPLVLITEENYLRLIGSCREYGYSEETIWNINACVRKLINIAYKNRYLAENPIDFWDSPRIKTGVKRETITFEEFEKISNFFETNEFIRVGENHYPKYKLLVNLLYYTGIRIGEAIALTYDDFEPYSSTPCGAQKNMRVLINKAYNSAFKLLKGTKNDKTRRIPLPERVINLFTAIKSAHLNSGGNTSARIFCWQHSACTFMLKKACASCNLPKFTCHDFRHPYVKHTTKIFSLRLKVFQAQPVPDALRKTRGTFLHLREGVNRILFL